MTIKIVTIHKEMIDDVHFFRHNFTYCGEYNEKEGIMQNKSKCEEKLLTRVPE